MTIKLGDNKEIQSKGEKNVAITTSPGKIKLLHHVQFVPNLAYNLLSVRQLLLNSYSVLFSNDACYIKELKYGNQIFKVPMTTNRVFSIKASNMESLNFSTAKDLGDLHAK